MPSERFYIDQDLQKNKTVTLTDQEFHHLVRVMRIKTGETVEIVNGKGKLASATLSQIEKKLALLHIQDVFVEPQPSSEIILAQAIPRPSCLDFILEKGTELGMTEVWLFPSQTGKKQPLSESQLNRMQAVTIASMKQCGRLFLPKIVIKPALEKWPKLTQTAFFGDLDPQAPLFSDVCQGNKNEDVMFFIGPESGFTDDEIAMLRNLGAKGVKLHWNILRAETAAIAALTLVAQFKRT